ncbi:hypothetical protein C7B64_17280 [Merismopedia glauca CCAP 1448/3]|uniref:Sulfatase-modifying factor enzyme domain-containing protein n=2 Tax=Merismopedia TaxID=53402 RepID=A0A2T1C074_9CYAN|nr:hypothetical protein C7B64_17280 [Merismopedia glauca CCAP 1448/3]
MAAAPVDLRVVHLIQKTLLPQPSSLVPVAEVFLSGTIQRVDYPRSDRNPQYEFLPEVRKLLNQATRLGETEKVLDIVSSYIAEKLGLSITSFTALLLKLQDLTTAQQEQILPFARVAVEVLQNLGGEYATFAQRVAGNSELEFIGFPPRQIFNIEVATIEVASESDTFEFTVATIEINASLLSSSNSPVELVDEKVFAQRGEHLNDLEQQLIQGVLANRTYAQIAATSRNSVEHLPENVATNLSKYLQNNVAPNLWQHLSAAFGEKVTKTKAKKLIKQWVAHRHITIHRHRQQAEYFIEYLGNIGNFGNLGNGVELEMVAIPAGSFLMGSPKDELERSDRESPQHRVTIQPFFLGRYPVTQAQWQAVASLPQQKRELNPNPSRFKGANRPVENVSWYDAIEFCARLSHATGKSYRLPSEAEWEYAARGGTTTPFHFGETITSELANYNANYTYGAGVKGVYRGETTPVGSFGVANAFGLSEIHGNVWEWCLDPWHGNYQGAPSDGRVWDEKIQNDIYLNIVKNLDILLESSERRVICGGSWYDYPIGCRCAYRLYDHPDYASSNLGFRVACGVPGT